MMKSSPQKNDSSNEDYQNLEEALAFPVDSAPQPLAHACVEVVAPIALPGNYPLDVEVNGQVLTVLVVRCSAGSLTPFNSLCYSMSEAFVRFYQCKAKRRRPRRTVVHWFGVSKRFSKAKI
jgi:hypothetical protein